MSENEKHEHVEEPVEHEEPHDKHEKKESKEVKKLKVRIEELEAQNAKLVNDYYKAYADAENIKKRNAADLEVAKKYRIQSFAKEILQVLDNFERTLGAMEDQESPLAKGIQMTYDQLVHALKNEGVVPIEALNQPLDPNLHHAIMTEVKEGVEPNIVIDVLQKGYLLKDRLLRPALVKVSE
jgi:molecular chaperone GrpE